MTLEKLTLSVTVSGTTREYEVSMLESVDISSQKDAMSIAPPGLSARENILLGVSGMQADISVGFKVHDDGTDKSNGTAPAGVYSNDTVVTVEEQIRYLEDYIHAPDFSASWSLDHVTGAAFNNDEVYLESVDVTPISMDSPKWKPATLRLRRGKSV